MKDSEAMVNVAEFNNPIEAELARGKLESAGIENFLAGENASTLYGGNLGAIVLQVPASVEAEARAALNTTIQAPMDTGRGPEPGTAAKTVSERNPAGRGAGESAGSPAASPAGSNAVSADGPEGPDGPDDPGQAGEL
jgi:hypothetical protein